MNIEHLHTIYIRFVNQISLPIVEGGMDTKLNTFHVEVNPELGSTVIITDSRIDVYLTTQDGKNLSFHFPMSNVASYSILEPGVLDD